MAKSLRGQHQLTAELARAARQLAFLTREALQLLYTSLLNTSDDRENVAVHANAS